MKLILLLITFLSLAHANTQKDTCCICVPSKEDPSTINECKRWLAENKSNCEYSKTLDHFMGYKLDETLRCEKVNIWGAYHGMSYRYIHTFQIIKDVTGTFDPVEVKFDASTCLIFNNVEKVEESAKRLVRDFPYVKFDLSGNQNNGTVFLNPLLGPTEMKTFSSKMHVKVKDYKTKISYAPCTSAGKYCDHADKDVGATNDSNSKFCTFEKRIVSQSCCNPNSKGYGRWSRPGESCQ